MSSTTVEKYCTNCAMGSWKYAPPAMSSTTPPAVTVLPMSLPRPDVLASSPSSESPAASRLSCTATCAASRAADTLRAPRCSAARPRACAAGVGAHPAGGAHAGARQSRNGGIAAEARALREACRGCTLGRPALGPSQGCVQYKGRSKDVVVTQRRRLVARAGLARVFRLVRSRGPVRHAACPRPRLTSCRHRQSVDHLHRNGAVAQAKCNAASRRHVRAERSAIVWSAQARREERPRFTLLVTRFAMRWAGAERTPSAPWRGAREALIALFERLAPS